MKGDLLISYKVETLDPQGQWLLIKHENTSESKWILQEESAKAYIDLAGLAQELGSYYLL